LQRRGIAYDSRYESRDRIHHNGSASFATVEDVIPNADLSIDIGVESLVDALVPSTDQQELVCFS
jgi:hypothetical protein